MTHLLRIPSIFSPASYEADEINSLTIYFIVAAMAILLAVIGLLIYVVVKFRGKPGDEEPRQFTGNRTVELFMIGIPTLLVGVFFYLTIRTMKRILPASGNRKPDVVITGHQFWWEARYSGTQAIVANEIHLPVGRKVLLHLNSDDVIHDWWVPALGSKMDAIPGRTNHLWLTIREPGIYEGACSEFCGAQHAWMRIRVVAQPESEYQQWLQERQQNAVKPTQTSAIAGADFFNRQTCGSCHRIRGTTANGDVGPDLTHFASRKTMLSGMMPNTRENLRKWLSDPQSIKPGSRMPRFIYPKDSINVLVDYLSTLQ
ncbi:cytochrome c oxidase subunit II [Spirosoma sp. SC4-14]|uniref:cytochrome c oxidase subunit II n=1 Tax=Spirosoma sp. SC4-14 TaxID=3128900 RepID=UPI0030D35E45